MIYNQDKSNNITQQPIIYINQPQQLLPQTNIIYHDRIIIERRSIIIAELLNIIGMFILIFGMHRFYLRYYCTGTILFLMSPFLQMIIWGIISVPCILFPPLILIPILCFTIIITIGYIWSIIDIFLICLIG